MLGVRTPQTPDSMLSLDHQLLTLNARASGKSFPDVCSGTLCCCKGYGTRPLSIASAKDK